jgi:hypothetical protein
MVDGGWWMVDPIRESAAVLSAIQHLQSAIYDLQSPSGGLAAAASMDPRGPRRECRGPFIQ